MFAFDGASCLLRVPRPIHGAVPIPDVAGYKGLSHTKFLRRRVANTTT